MVPSDRSVVSCDPRTCSSSNIFRSNSSSCSKVRIVARATAAGVASRVLRSSTTRLSLPLAQFLRGLLLVGAQFGQESGINLVHRRVFAPQIPAQESGSSAGDLAKSGEAARCSITWRMRSHRSCSACTRALRLEISSAMVPAESSAWSWATLEQMSAFLSKRAADCFAPHSEYPAEM